MELLEAVRAVFKELIAPELEAIKGDLREIKAVLLQHDERLRNLETRATQQDLRIDRLSQEIARESEALTNRMDRNRDELLQRIETVRVELAGKIEAVEARVMEQSALLTARVDAMNARLDSLFRPPKPPGLRPKRGVAQRRSSSHRGKSRS